ncbi:PD-(D/E)XK nuclease family protein [bacterium]|nr:PD-(D/E)XK nuclease family protein [bacterium]
MAIVNSRNYSKLAEDNPFDFDERVVFEEHRHLYFVDGVQVPISITGVLKKHDPAPFDAPKIITRCWRAWKRNGRKPELAEVLVDVEDDEDAIIAVQKVWTRSSELGTLLHKRFEALANEADTEDGEFEPVNHEWTKLVGALDGLGWAPVRSELSVFYTNKMGKVVAAGQIDMLAVDKDNKFVMIDLKRSSKDIGPEQTPFRPGEWTEYFKYSLQLACYSLMVEQLTGKKVESQNRYLLVVDKARAVWIKCLDLDEKAREMMESL